MLRNPIVQLTHGGYPPCLFSLRDFRVVPVESGLCYGGGIKQFGIQALGAGTAFVWAFGLGLVLFGIISKSVGLRVSAEEELKGLEIGEHGMEAYSGFQIFSTT